MALFNAPLPQHDHALRAVIAALNIRERLASFHCEDTDDGVLHFKIGVASGEAIVGNAGMPDLMNYTAVGDTVNVAKRLEERAELDQILISPGTSAAVRGEVNVRTLGPFQLKGRTAPIEVFEVPPRQLVSLGDQGG
jgi:adenylate cyclase